MSSFLELAGHFLHAVLQSILLWAPIVEPLPEPTFPPSWWYRCHSWSDWYYNRDSEGRPNEEFLAKYWSCLWQHVGDLVSSLADAAVAVLRVFVLALLGSLPRIYSTFAGWIGAVDIKLGSLLPPWATSALAGLRWLWDHLPQDIRDNVISWAGKFASLLQKAQTWVRSVYEWARQRVYDLWNWFQRTGQAVGEWWRVNAPWLTELVRNPLGMIAAVLGPAWRFLLAFWRDPVGTVTAWLNPYWAQLVTFCRDCLMFYYNLWGSYWRIMGEFFDDPLEWFYVRAADFLAEKMG